MAVGQATLAAVMTLTDEASPGLARITRQTVSAGTAFRTALPRLASFGTALTGLLIATGALDNKMGRTITSTLAFASAFASAIPAITSLLPVIRSLNTTLRTTAVIQGILAGLSGIGIGKIALGVGGALAIGAGIAGGIALSNRGDGISSSSAATSNNGVNRGNGGSAPTPIVNNGVIVTNEGAMRDLADQVTRVQASNAKLGR